MPSIGGRTAARADPYQPWYASARRGRPVCNEIPILSSGARYLQQPSRTYGTPLLNLSLSKHLWVLSRRNCIRTHRRRNSPGIHDPYPRVRGRLCEHFPFFVPPQPSPATAGTTSTRATTDAVVSSTVAIPSIAITFPTRYCMGSSAKRRSSYSKTSVGKWGGRAQVMMSLCMLYGVSLANNPTLILALVISRVL